MYINVEKTYYFLPPTYLLVIRDIKLRVNKLSLILETMIIITFILTNLIVIGGSNVPFLLWPNFHDFGKNEQTDFFTFLNKSTNPCNNFYEYACGGWIKKTVQPESQPIWNHWQSVTQIIFKRIETILQSKQSGPKYFLKARNMYNACLYNKYSETKYLNNLKSIIDGLHRWPMATNAWNASGYDWAINVAKITRIFGIHPLLKMHVFIDMKNTSQHILYVEPGELNLPQTILLKPQKYKRYIKAYQVWIVETIRYLFPNTTSCLKDVTQMINFEMELAKLNLYKDASEKISITRLTKEFPIKWMQVFDQLFYFTSVKMNPNDIVIIRSRKYLAKFLFLLSNTKSEIIGNYLIWSTVKHLSRDTTKYMRRLSFTMDNIIFGVKTDIPRTEECINKLNMYMGTTLIPKYSKLYLDSQTVKEVNKIIENIKKEFVKMLEQNSWLNNKTRNYAVEKIEALKYVIAYPEVLNNDTLLENAFERVNISNNHLWNIMQLKSLKMTNDLQQLRQPVNFQWPGSVFEVNAYYNVLQNSIFIPMGMLEPPFFDITGSMVHNYGALGSLIGHEISHALDVLGRHADKYGNIRNWWSENDIHQYEDTVSCFKQQYTNYKVDGISTLGENIADNVGLQISYNAYKNTKGFPTSYFREFTADQVFFISFSQLWCEISSENELTNEEGYPPVTIRVLGSLHNSEEFAKAFDCKMDIKNCTLW